MRVAILDDVHDAYERTSGVLRLRERAEVRVFTEPFGAPTALRGFDAVVAKRERTRFTRALLGQLPALRIIAQTGIIVAKASGGFSRGAAELAIGLAIAVMRRIPAVDRDVKRDTWRTPTTPVLHGKTLGIVGLG